MSSLMRSLLHGGMPRRKESQDWSSMSFKSSSSSGAEMWTLTRRSICVRSVASEIPKRSSHPSSRINHASQDLTVETKIIKKRAATPVQELDRRNVVEERAHLLLPGISRKEGTGEELVAFFLRRKDWFRDVAVVTVLAAAILAAVAEKEAKLQLPSLPRPRKECPNGITGRTPKEPAHQVPIDSIRRGRLVENGFVYRQTFVVRSYEVGFDRTASIGTLANLFQETALNHVGMADFVGDGMGTTHAMMRHRLIWVVTKMHIEVVDFPVWGDVVEIDSWVCASGKNGMRRDFLVRDYLSGQVRARATSHWAMMNQDTRKLSKMPDAVHAEISPYFLERSVMRDEACTRIQKLDDSAPYVKSGLVPRLHDMDMNQHVNHVKYISWVLESMPQSLLVAYELTGMTLAYRKECSHSDIVCSLTSPDSRHSLFVDSEEANLHCLNAQKPAVCDGSLPSTSIKNPRITTPGPICFTHLLRMQADSTEILRGHTVWRLKKRYS